jgi:hypothetical protein
LCNRAVVQATLYDQILVHAQWKIFFDCTKLDKKIVHLLLLQIPFVRNGLFFYFFGKKSPESGKNVPKIRVLSA